MNRSDFKRKLGKLMGTTANPQISNTMETCDDDPSGEYEEPQMLNLDFRASADYITANVYSPTPLSDPNTKNDSNTAQLPYYLDMEKTKAVLDSPRFRFDAKPLPTLDVINRPPMPLPVDASPLKSNKQLPTKPTPPSKPAIPMRPVKPHTSQLEFSQGYDSNDESIYELEPKVEETKPVKKPPPNIKPKINLFKGTSVRNAPILSSSSLKTPNKTLTLEEPKKKSVSEIKSKKEDKNVQEKVISKNNPKFNTTKETPVRNNYRVQRPAAPAPPISLKPHNETPLSYREDNNEEESIYEMEPQIEQIKPIEKPVIQVKPKINPRIPGSNTEKPKPPPPPKDLKNSVQNYQNYDRNEGSIYEMEPQIEQTNPKNKPLPQVRPKINPRAIGIIDSNIERTKIQPLPKNLKTNDSNEESFYELEPDIEKTKPNESVLNINPKTARVKEAPIKNYTFVHKPLASATQNSLNNSNKKQSFCKRSDSFKTGQMPGIKMGNKIRDIKNDLVKNTQKSETPSPPKNLIAQSGVQEPIWNVSNITELPKPPPLTKQFSLTNFQDIPSDSSEEEIESRVDATQSRFYRNTDRKGTKYLLQNRGDGAFLFRPSDAYKLVLTVVYNKQFHKLGIDCNDKDRFYCIGDEANTFKTLDELVDYYKVNPLSVKSNDGVKNLYLRDVL
ncbi:uncharacterized protein LOC143191279 isoform X1 [Rhynchophorus ferrugineus]|uniref:uncharacterized protein LOC143191279 isoform X1 n=1 Tax=Rhynchophorus ferrugineus TaxID=354439 RepID=UPI003FCC7392